MIYIPILKTRAEEKNVAKKMNECFSDSMIPLFEVLTDEYETKYKVNPITNDFIYEQHGKKRMRAKEEPTENDIITLDYINRLVANKLVFIEYFRFNIKKYSNKVDVSKAELAWRLSKNVELYKKRIKGISKFSNMIPVISIKDGFDMRNKELEIFLQELQIENNSVALRITEEWLEKYKDVIRTKLRKSDYLLFDIGEQNPESKFIELEEVVECESNAKVILLNSPRKAAIKNGEYDIHGITDLINNCARDVAEKHNLDGYGDYCGLKDTLPSKGGSNGTGAALALLYDYTNNSFYSYANHDTSQGMHGYKRLIQIILADKSVLDPSNECQSIKKIESMNSTGNYGSWSTWHNINATRYINQVYKHN